MLEAKRPGLGVALTFVVLRDSHVCISKEAYVQGCNVGDIDEKKDEKIYVFLYRPIVLSPKGQLPVWFYKDLLILIAPNKYQLRKTILNVLVIAYALLKYASTSNQVELNSAYINKYILQIVWYRKSALDVLPLPVK